MIGHVSSTSVPVTDRDRALAFWRHTLGLTVTADADYMMHGQRWIMLKPEGARTQIQATARRT